MKLPIQENLSVSKSLLVLAAVASMFPAGEAVAISYSDRATTNNNYHLQHTIRCNNTYAVGIEAKEQYNYGVVDFRLKCAQSPTFTNWATGNQNQNEHHARTAPSNYGLIGVLVHEQYNYGVIDLQPAYQSLSADNTVSWLSPLTMNSNANETSNITCPSGQHMVGLNVFEQHGYGIVDVQLICDEFRPSSESLPPVISPSQNNSGGSDNLIDEVLDVLDILF
ncbi:MAG: hypothetical protein AAGD09_06270 [Cyanobacteria bacterium P01_F01_bin.56]